MTEKVTDNNDRAEGDSEKTNAVLTGCSVVLCSSRCVASCVVLPDWID